jgi:ATPase family associated with various cellular activities (AAA)
MAGYRKHISREALEFEMLELAQAFGPDNYDNFLLAKHFRKDALFCRNYTGVVDARKASQEMKEKICFSHVRVRRPDQQKKTIEHGSGNHLYRLSRTAFALINKAQISIYAESAAEADKQIEWAITQFAGDEMPAVPQFGIITTEMGGTLTTLAVDLPDLGPVTEAELELHYGEDFLPWHNSFVDSLSKREHGIAVLRGQPGTGKTTYLRKLIMMLMPTHRFLFLPLKLVQILNNPDTVSFWIEQKKAQPNRKLVVILEDAEHFLTQRGPDNASDVADLLNAGDGLLSDFLQIQMICTLNCEFQNIDKAIVRPGRLITYREFARLNPRHAKKLAAAKNLSLRPQDSYSLAEIYNGGALQEPSLTRAEVGFKC